VWYCSLNPLLSVLLLVLALPSAGHAQSLTKTPSEPPSDLERAGRVTHPPVNEMSGIVRSRWQDNVWWVHNDSGDEPRIFALDSTGSAHVAPWHTGDYAAGDGATKQEEPLWPGVQLGAAAHIDYEDIAVEDSILYLGDIGNNGNARRDLGIYVIREPYFYDRRTRPLKHIPIAYPDQDAFPAKKWHFDAESLFIDDGTLYLLTKHRANQQIGQFADGTKLYRLDSKRPQQVNELTLVDRHESIPPPTAAALSPNGEWLAVLGYSSLWLFPRPAAGDDWLSTEPRRFKLDANKTKQAEAVTWDDGHTLRITNEQGDVWTLSGKTVGGNNSHR